MKKYYALIYIIICQTCNLYAQSGLIDPYNLGIVSTQNVGPVPLYNNSSMQIVYNSLLSAGPGGYDGELMIGLREHPISITGIYNDHALKYKMEVVSFPFTINCWNDNGCASTSLDRKFEMPDEPYSNTFHGWGTGSLSSNYLKNIRDDGIFYQATLGGVHFSGADDHPEALVSTTFLNSTFSPGSNWRHNFPHTVIKYKIYIYCTSSFTSDIIDSVEWVYDNTRGRMKYYPFKNTNSFNNGDEGRYDVVFVPEIISIPQANQDYTDLVTNSNWIDGGTINYFPFKGVGIVAGCPQGFGYTTDTETDLFKGYDVISSQYTTYFADSPPYSLLSTFLRSKNLTTFAGYRINGSQIEIASSYEGIEHMYFINRGYPDLDLSVINGTDKVIYNPSRVTIDPDAGLSNGTNPPIEVIFPEDYTYKTILGRYPSHKQVSNASLDPQNGTYADLTKVPVPVNAADLHPIIYDPLDYPQVMWDDPLTGPHLFYDDERFGYYYIEDKATLTISSCVKLFDARFAVNAGGTMRFNDYSQILGYEDKVNNNGRYKIRGEGGAILRNYSSVQYVQNGNIFQSIPLNYIATSHIIAGENVDPDTDQPTGIYEIKAGADVTFTSGDYIHLKDGFYVSGGDFHAVINENLPVPIICYANNIQNGGNRTMQQPSTDQTYNLNSISVLPNPNHGTFTISMNGNNSIIAVSLFDITGRCVYYHSKLNEKSHEIQLNSDQSGLFIAKVENNIGEITMIKVIVE